MATIQLRIQRTDNSTIIASRTGADADLTRVLNALGAMMGKTPQQVVEYALDRLMAQATALTKDREQRAVSVPDIPIT